MKLNSGDRISTDVMNDIISAWVDAEMPIPAHDKNSEDSERIRNAQGKRFEQIVNMADDEFRALYREKTGDDLSPMNSDGSYTVL